MIRPTVIVLLVCGLIAAVLTPAHAIAPDSASILMPERDDPRRALHIIMTSGKLRLVGTEGDSLRVSAIRFKDRDIPEDTHASADPRAEGLTRLTHRSTGLALEERLDGIEMSFDQITAPHDIRVYVPNDVPLIVSAEYDGEVVVIGMTGPVTVESERTDVFVHDTSGPIRVETVDGWIRLTDITGSVEANTNFGGIEAVIRELSPEHPIWLTAATGPIDIALPGDADASLHLRSTWGEIYSEFDVALKLARGAEAREELPQPPPAATEPPRAMASLRQAPAPEKRSERSRDVAGLADSMAREDAEMSIASEEMVPVADAPVSLYDLPRAKPMAPVAPPASRRYVGNIGSGGVDIRVTTGARNIYIRKVKREQP